MSGDSISHQVSQMDRFCRRDFLQRSGNGLGWIALAALQARTAMAADAPPQPHHPPRAKRVIFLFMEGGPSHVDSFDSKPSLQRAGGRYLPSVFPFRPHGQSGLMISDAFPRLASHADDLCLLNGMQTPNASHQQAIMALHTGSETFVRPSMGSWIVYGLGREAEDLPAFITLNPSRIRVVPCCMDPPS